uniref:Uncharacterized protein n=1 Tax=Oryza sativa subsp. japonica TaxID=39947 RepID=Q67X23_ORYSJ|nr:hypothetical protein [Oryza sativa Japonica Group]
MLAAAAATQHLESFLPHLASLPYYKQFHARLLTSGHLGAHPGLRARFLDCLALSLRSPMRCSSSTPSPPRPPTTSTPRSGGSPPRRTRPARSSSSRAVSPPPHPPPGSPAGVKDSYTLLSIKMNLN